MLLFLSNFVHPSIAGVTVGHRYSGVNGDTCCCSTGTLHAVLGRWLAAKDRSVGERLSCYRAVVHHHRRLQMSVIHHWRLYHSIVIRTQVMAVDTHTGSDGGYTHR